MAEDGSCECNSVKNSSVSRTKPINEFILVLFIILCLCLNVLCASICNEDTCVNGKCINNSTVCSCFDGWSGPSCIYCSGRIRLSEQTGVITEGPGNYSEDNKCMWLLEPNQAGSPIWFSADQFATECGWDHLYIFDGDSVYSPLIAAYSGLISQERSENTSMADIVAKSGKAYLYFYSDAAYNMTGFHLTYSVGQCPRNCSGRGTCHRDSGCECDDGYKGISCEVESCPGNCSGQGSCSEGRCHCQAGYKGKDCSIPSYKESWIRLDNNSPPEGRSSAASVLINDELWVLGGYAFGQTINFTIVYNITSWKWRLVNALSSDNPTQLYGHSLIKYKDVLFMFGGVSEQRIQSGLWMYNITSNLWTYHDYNNTEALAGHSAVVIGSTMYIIFGHSPIYGYMNRVREVKLDSPNKEMSLVNTSGALVKGGYGHTSVYFHKTDEIFVFGGYISGSTTQYYLTDKLLSYQPHLKYWRILAVSGSPRYLHSAVFLYDKMLVFGGNTHNDTSISHGAKCYSPDLMMYDPGCNSWTRLKTTQNVMYSERFGHVAHTYTQPDGRSKMYIFGGFNGVILNDLLEYEPDQCEQDGMNKTACLTHNLGPRCAWSTSSGCYQFPEVSKADWNSHLVDYRRAHNCTATEGAAEYCKGEKSCGSCLSTAYNCKWCSNNCSTSCSASEQYAVSDVSQCPRKYSVACDQINNCHACAMYPDCVWDKPSGCKFNRDKNMLHSNEVLLKNKADPPVCDTPCYEHTSCENCTAKSCMWCGPLSRCVETNSYVASFLYGQCQEWTTLGERCSTTRCEDLRSCEDCKSNPSCGWCNDASLTGLGVCMPGSASGPVKYNSTTGEHKLDLATCPVQRWHFIDCPLCQCNGHSSCTNTSDPSKCDKCMNLTEGEHCELCIKDYHGNPKNGGNCTKCSCNGQADTCNRETGKCYCRTKGVEGDKCDKCETTSNYFGNPNNGGTCYYDLKTDYQFTFNLSKPNDNYLTRINFMNIPLSSDRDVDFTVNCSGAAYLNITWKSKSMPQEQFKVQEYMCTYFRAKFEHKEFDFGPEENVTFLVYVYGFETPFRLQISFSQFPKIDLVHFFVIFFSCFLLLLTVAAVLYKIKHKYDSYRRRQRMIVEMEEMASRPFAVVGLEIDRKFDNSAASSKKDTNPDLRKRKQISNKPSQITLEPLHHQKAGVLSLFVQLPTGTEEWTPAGHSGLAIGSALITLGHQRKQSIEHGKTDKNKHKKHAFTSPDTCV